MGKRKIINDPIYGFIQFDFDIIYDLIDHPIFQRLRHISQMGLSSMVYPGAVHSRFQHALGALHLMTKSIRILRSKNIQITDKEAEGVSVAILLHDIGHGPYSHSLENIIVPISHESITSLLLHRLNEEFNGRLEVAIAIFKGKYHKHFLHQLVSGQIDMDRLDYITRDSFYTGVAEGRIGYDRIINMLNVVDNSIVVEEKGIYSIEKFLHSRSIMYWQVYLHKTAISAEQMLIKLISHLIESILKNTYSGPDLPSSFTKIIQYDFQNTKEASLDQFILLDDHDIQQIIKLCINSEDYILRFLAIGLKERKLHKIILRDTPFNSDYISEIRQKVVNYYSLNNDLAEILVINGSETNLTYNNTKDEILVLSKKGEITPLSNHISLINTGNIVSKYFLCYPEFIS